ncbi:type IV pilus secretin PilQ family protein [Lysobacter pythonis]|uniref:Type IV pilus secretin PilQ family protein n=2 Tax=Solilutibacter pythonis TaxID=2483112 RepID=A0A3M2I1E1_9GAMM|nr:type IV pilus secretin PilQ family protein [Lysobacter pythonis]
MPSYTISRPLRTVLAGLTCGMFAASASAGQPVTAPLPAPQTVATTMPAPAAAPAVSNIDFRRGTDGAGRLVVSFSGEGAAPDLRNQGSQVVVDLGQAQLPAALAKNLDVTDFATPVRRIESGGRRIVLDTSGAFESMAYQRGREYIVEILPRTEQVAQGALASTIASAAQSAAAKSDARVYRGKPVNFNFQDIPVRPVLQLIAEESGLNIVASDTVAGNITLRLVNVPWDQALDLILQAKGLDKRRQGNVIWVAPQSEISKYEQDKEDARIALENRQDLTTEFIRINYHSAEAIYKALTEAKGIGGGSSQPGGGSGGSNQEGSFLSPRGRLVADQRTNTLMISDIPKKVEAMRRLINEIDRPVDQVVIEARIVIATESFARDLGARFGVSGSRKGTNQAGIGGKLPGSGSTSRLPGGLNVDLPASPSTGSAAGIAYTLLGANFSLDLELTAMQQQQRGEVLSNPRILTTNQREAVIQQGKEIGYVTTTASAGGVAMPTVQFKDVLLELKVTPTITNDDRVFLNMFVTKNEVDSYLNSSIGRVPVIAKRQINTAALIENGQTVVVGGVYEFKDTDSIRKVPFLGDLPVLGNLFKNKSFGNEKAELLIFVTPKILRVQQQMH